MSKKPVDLDDCKALVEELLANRIQDKDLGDVSPVIWERGFLTGVLARLALEDVDVRWRLQQMVKHSRR